MLDQIFNMNSPEQNRLLEPLDPVSRIERESPEDKADDDSSIPDPSLEDTPESVININLDVPGTIGMSRLSNTNQQYHQGFQGQNPQGSQRSDKIKAIAS